MSVWTTAESRGFLLCVVPKKVPWPRVRFLRWENSFRSQVEQRRHEGLDSIRLHHLNADLNQMVD